MADGESLRERVDALAPWFHNIDLGDGLHTAPDHFLGDYPAFKSARFANTNPGDWTNWWAPNRAGSEAMLRAAGFTVEAHPEDEVYWCRVAPVPYARFGPAAVYPSTGDAR